MKASLSEQVSGILFIIAIFINFLDRVFFYIRMSFICLFVSLIKVSVMFLLAWKITASLANSSPRPRFTTSGVHRGMQGYAKDESDVQAGHGMLNEMTNVSG